MTLKQWLSVTEPVGLYVRLWNQFSDEDKPTWEGDILDIPWIYIDDKIGIEYEDTGKIKSDDAIWLNVEKNEYNVDMIYVNINIIS